MNSSRSADHQTRTRVPDPHLDRPERVRAAINHKLLLTASALAYRMAARTVQGWRARHGRTPSSGETPTSRMHLAVLFTCCPALLDALFACAPAYPTHSHSLSLTTACARGVYIRLAPALLHSLFCFLYQPLTHQRRDLKLQDRDSSALFSHREVRTSIVELSHETSKNRSRYINTTQHQHHSARDR